MTQWDVLTSSGKHVYRAALASAEVRANAAETARRISMLINSFGSERALSSGFRDKESNTRAGGAKRSTHLEGKAADIEDPDGRLALFCVRNEDLLRHFELWMEDPHFTPGWVHLQTRPVSVTIFKPY